MSGKWYFSRNSKQRLGPFTFEQLRQLAAKGRLKPSDMLLRPGSRKWTSAGEISGLFEAAVEVLPVDQADADYRTKSKQKTLVLALIIVACLIVVGGLLLLLLLADPETAGAVVLIAAFVFLILAVPCGAIIGIVFLIRVAFGGTCQICPYCGKGRAREQIGEKIIEEKKCYGLVTRSAYSSSYGSVSGSRHHWDSIRTSGSTSWKERVPVIRTTYLLTYECKFCQARWTREKVEEVEDFDIER